MDGEAETLPSPPRRSYLANASHKPRDHDGAVENTLESRHAIVNHARATLHIVAAAALGPVAVLQLYTPFTPISVRVW